MTVAPSPITGKEGRPTTLIIAAVAVLLVAGAVYAVIILPSNQSVQILTSGRNFILDPTRFTYFQFAISTSSKITGAFQATDDITVYIADPASFAQYSAGYACYSCHRATGSTVSMNVSLPAGTYYLIFEDWPSQRSGVSVTITQTIVAVPS